MPQTASSIIRLAAFQAKFVGAGGTAPGQTEAIGLTQLNIVLDHISRTIDLFAAVGTWNFTFNTALTTLGGGNISQSGPNPLPMDYLRVQTAGGSTGAQRSSKWYLDGVPYDMTEVDLTEFDDFIQQAGIQAQPYAWAKDLSQYSVQAQVTGSVTIGNQTVGNLSSTTGMVPGMSISGGIGPLVVITPGTTILSVDSGSSTITLSQVPSLPSQLAQTPSTPFSGCSLTVGYPGVGLPYPPPAGAYNAMIRYQRLMPPLTTTQVNAGAICWFPDDDVLIELLAARLMAYSGDNREGQSEAMFKRRMAEYVARADDRDNRAQYAQLDRRFFGPNFSWLANTKKVGF